MIRVFKPTDRDFTSNGDAVIVPIKARVKNNMNGEFFIELTCESKFYKYLDQGNIIITPTPQGEQAFRIDNQLSRKGERITIKARHVFYDAEKLVVADSYAVDLNCEQALKHFNAATDSTSPFTMHSDITSLNSFRCVRKSLAEAIGTVIERWGGYLVRNNWDISVNKSVGRDYGVTIRYAKNLKELTASYDFSGVATKLLPVGKDGILLPELYVSSSKQYDIPYTKVVSIQQDITEDDYSTEEEYQAAVIADLRTQAQALVNKTCIPVITYTLKGNPEKVQDIGDVIEVIDERIGVNITTQVIGYEWDVITEQYASLTFGNFGNTLSGLMAKVNADTKGVVNEAVGEVKTEFKSSINNIYDLLQGSYVLYRGYDILLLDRIPAGTAQNVIKFSKDGISVSSNGINGDFKEVYNIATKKLSVPSISLNGKDLQNTLDDKISYDNLKAGNNITITRKGKILTINGTDVGGGSNIYYGTEEPAASLGVDRDLYCKLGDLPTYIVDSVEYNNLDHNTLTKIAYNEFSGNMSGVQVTTSLHDPDREYIYLDGLIKGNTYTLTVKCTLTDGIIHRYSSGSYANNYFTVTDDTEDFSNPPIIILDDTFNAEQTKSSIFVAKDTNILVFAFWAMQDGHNAAITCSSIKIEGNFRKIVKIYDKVGNGWVDYEGGESYTAGSNIDITNNVISGAYQAFTGTDGTADGAQGLVPAPTTSDVGKVLGANGQWVEQTGGTEVEANPSGVATENLYTVDIGGTIYDIKSGNGNFKTKVLLNQAATSGTYSLADDYTNYDLLAFWTTGQGYESGEAGVVVMTVDDLKKAQAENRVLTMFGYYNRYYNFYITPSQFTVQGRNDMTVVKIVGYKIYADCYNPIIYSTEEREVGVWIDNKPLYAKTVTTNGSVPSGAVLISREVINANYDLILYTKSSDTAGSGSYNTLGVPNVHYSTDEQVIGTWMGETLYQKCVATGGSEPSGATLVERTAMASTGYDTIKYIKS